MLVRWSSNYCYSHLFYVAVYRCSLCYDVWIAYGNTRIVAGNVVDYNSTNDNRRTGSDISLMNIKRGSWHYNIAHFASSKLEKEIHTRGGYYGRIARGIISLTSLLTLVVSLVLGPVLYTMFATGHLEIGNVHSVLLTLGMLGLFFDALIVGGTFIFLTVIILSVLNVYILVPITQWLNKRQGNGILSTYLTSLSDKIQYGNDDVDTD